MGRFGTPVGQTSFVTRVGKHFRALFIVLIAAVVSFGFNPELSHGADELQITTEPQRSETATAVVAPTRVYVGVYVNNIREVNLKNNQYVVDLWLWFRWKGKEVNPPESFEVINGNSEIISGPIKDTVAGWNYSAVRLLSTVAQAFDVSNFPLDNHVLELSIEDGAHESHELVFKPDSENSRIEGGIVIQGWDVMEMTTNVSTHEYLSNYGDISLPTDNLALHSRFTASISLERPGPLYFFKLFWGLFISTLIGFLAFFIRPTLLDARFGVSVGSLFAAVGSSYVVSSALPDVNQVTLTDRLVMLSVGFVFITLIESVISLRLATNGREHTSRRLDRFAALVFCSGYLILCVLVIL